MLSDNMPWATIMIGGLVLVAAGVGGAVVIWGNDGALSFEQYLDLLKNFAIAVGILGVGRGIVAHGKKTAEASALDDQTLLTSLPPDQEWREGASDFSDDLTNTLTADDFLEDAVVGGNGSPAAG